MDAHHSMSLGYEKYKSVKQIGAQGAYISDFIDLFIVTRRIQKFSPLSLGARQRNQQFNFKVVRFPPTYRQ
jgi:hypothetical protein